MGKPYKLHDVPTRNTNETRPVAAPPAGQSIVRSRQSGDPLPPSGTDAVDHPPVIQWPEAHPVDHKPFKVNQ